MKQKDKIAWWDKNERVNKTRDITRGDLVSDAEGNFGVVVKIEPGTNDEDHGTIYVWQSERLGYGGDNCEHYSYTNWKRMLRIYND